MSLRQRLMYLGASGLILGASTFLAPLEVLPSGPNLTPYDDIGGVSTWCYGETGGRPKTQYTLAECDAMLLVSVQKHWDGIKDAVPYDAPQSVKEAMTSVAYNVGVAGWRHPVFTRPLAGGDWKGACAAITAPWQGKRGVAKGFKATVKGKPARGLENRRAKEYKLCMRDL